MKEHAIRLGRNRSLVGILTENGIWNSTRGNDSTAVLLLSPQYDHHVGPNGIYVRLARRLASMGYVALRFGHSGSGDSGPRRDKVPELMSVIDETQNAMDAVERLLGVKRFVLLGVCFGAGVAFQVAALDRRVRGAVMINPPIPELSENELTQRHLYYWHGGAIRNMRSWKRLLLLQSDFRAIMKSIKMRIKKSLQSGHAQPTDYPLIVQRLAESMRSIRANEVNLLIIRTDDIAGDQFMREFMYEEYKALMDMGLIRIAVIKNSDHIITPLAAQQQFLELTSEWMVEKY